VDIKKCSQCGNTKEIKEFYQRKKYRSGEYYERCKECFKKRGKEYYHLNHERQLTLALKRKARYRKERFDYLEKIKNNPCTDCGKIYPPWVMDFDHRESEVKIGTISWLAIHDTANLEKINKEIEKCDLVCANCHRQRTHDRLKSRNSAAVAKLVKALV
jgi:hypothetical protein